MTLYRWHWHRPGSVLPKIAVRSSQDASLAGTIRTCSSVISPVVAMLVIMFRTLESNPDVLLPDCGDAVKPEASPTARALLALELIQGSPGITADGLAAKLGVSERAARRYVGILRQAGIPIESVRGPYGGYRVGRGLRLPPLMFSATEALGLVMAVLEGPRGADDPVENALGKIIRV